MKKKLLFFIFCALMGATAVAAADATVEERRTKTITTPAGVIYQLDYDSKWTSRDFFYVNAHEINMTAFPTGSESPEITTVVRSTTLGGTGTHDYTFSDYNDTDCTVAYTKSACWNIRGGGPNVTLTRLAETAHNWDVLWTMNPNGSHTRSCQHPVCQQKQTCNGHFGPWVTNNNGTHSRACVLDSTHTFTSSCLLGALVPYQAAVHTPTALLPSVEAHYQCVVCGQLFSDELDAVSLADLTGETPQHSLSNWINTDPATHWKECACGYTEQQDAHQYTDSLDPDCNVCQHVRSSFQLTFLPNGGEGTMAPQTFYQGGPQSLKANAFTRSGFHFLGWSTQPDGSGTFLANGAVLTLNAPAQLYAVWQEITLPPQTGDSASPMLWIALCVLSLIAAALLCRKARG